MGVKNESDTETIPPLPIPEQLQHIQKWFASIIVRPLVENDLIDPLSPSGVVIKKEAARFIAPSPTLRPDQRIQIYNQQYWWRILDVLQTNFPLLLRLFGPHDFNQKIAIPYLVKHPPDTWCLTSLGDQLPQWIQKEYNEKDKQLVYDATLLDQMFAYSFLGLQLPALDFELLSKNDPEVLLEVPFCLQPHLFLMNFRYDLPHFREELLKQEPSYWIENDFPSLEQDKAYYFVLFRNHKNNVSWKDLPKDEYLLLSQFAANAGLSILSACDWIEEQPLEQQENMSMQLQKWIQDWTRFGWLTLSDRSKL